MWFKSKKQTTKTVTDGLRRLESRLEELFEGSVMRFFPDGQHDLSASLVGALRQGILKSPDGELLGPNLYTLEVNPTRVELMRSDVFFLEGLRSSVKEAGDEIGLHFSGPLSIQVNPAPELVDDQIRVSAIYSQIGLTGTSTIETETIDQSVRIPANAFLIIDGTEVYPLRVPVLNIGRRADNHLIIDDPHISRVHAQLRLVRDQYVIFDLESSGGTWVNGERIHQRALQPGDVISLSGVPLVFGQDSRLADETQRMSLS